MSTTEELLTRLAEKVVQVLKNKLIQVDWVVGDVDEDGKRPEGGYQITYQAETSIKTSDSFDSSLWLVYETLGADLASLEGTVADNVLVTGAWSLPKHRAIGEFNGFFCDRYRMIFADIRARESAHRAGTKHKPIKPYHFIATTKTIYPEFYDKFISTGIKEGLFQENNVTRALNVQLEEITNICVDAIEHRDKLKAAWVNELCEFDVQLTEKRISTGVCRTIVTMTGTSTNIPGSWDSSSNHWAGTITSSTMHPTAQTLVWTSNTSSIIKK